MINVRLSSITEDTIFLSVQDQPRDEGLSESVPPSNELKLENESSCIVERWKNFISRTTLHGIKYAFDDGPVRLRRCDDET